MNILICGGKKFFHFGYFQLVMNQILDDYKEKNIILGGCRELNSVAKKYADEKKLRCEELSSDHQIDLCIAFLEIKEEKSPRILEIMKKNKIKTVEVPYESNEAFALVFPCPWLDEDEFYDEETGEYDVDFLEDLNLPEGFHDGEFDNYFAKDELYMPEISATYHTSKGNELHYFGYIVNKESPKYGKEKYFDFLKTEDAFDNGDYNEIIQGCENYGEIYDFTMIVKTRSDSYLSRQFDNYGRDVTPLVYADLEKKQLDGEIDLSEHGNILVIDNTDGCGSDFEQIVNILENNGFSGIITVMSITIDN